MAGLKYYTTWQVLTAFSAEDLNWKMSFGH